jgi:hypothetical protein
LRSGATRFLDIAPADRLLAYVRPGATARDDILVLLNWSDAPLETRLPVRGDSVDLLSGQALSGSRSITLPPYGLRIPRAALKSITMPRAAPMPPLPPAIDVKMLSSLI